MAWPVPAPPSALAVGSTGTIRATTNGGSTWSGQTSGVSGSSRARRPVAGTAAFAYVVGDGGTIVATTNGGTTWTTQTSGNLTNDGIAWGGLPDGHDLLRGE